MGGRGASSGLANNPYRAWTADRLQVEIDRVDADIRQKQRIASLDRRNGTATGVIKRKAAAAERSLEKLRDKEDKLLQALWSARRRRGDFRFRIRR